MDNKIMTPIAWADHTCKPNKSRNTPELMQQYADYYAREVSVAFGLNVDDYGWSEKDMRNKFDQFINDQKKVTPIDNDLN